MKYNLMKLIALVLAILLMLSLTGLGEVVIEDGASVDGIIPEDNPYPEDLEVDGQLDALEAQILDFGLQTPEKAEEAVTEEITEDKTSINALVRKVSIGVKEKYTIDTSSLSGKLTFATANKTIATVSKKGVVVGKKVGSTKITVTDGQGKKYKITFTVAKAPDKVTVNADEATLEIGDTLQLKAKLPNKTASNKLTWKSNNHRVATVSEDGKVTAKAAGTANITVKTFNDKTAICKVTVKGDEPEPTPTPTPTSTPKPIPKILTLSGGLPLKLSMGVYPTEQEYMIDSFKCEVVECGNYTYQYKFSFGGVKTSDINGDSNFTQYPIYWELYGDLRGTSVRVDSGVIRTPLVRVGDRWSMDSCYGMTRDLNYDSECKLSNYLSIRTFS